LLIAVAIIKFDPADTEEVLECASKIEAYKRNEAGCLYCAYASRLDNENELLAVTIYDGMESFEKHAELMKSDPEMTPTIARWVEIKTIEGAVIEGSSTDISHLLGGFELEQLGKV